MRADLHIHTTASDGIFPPGAILAMAKEIPLQVIAITDHDSMSGIPEALQASASCQIRVIPGVEISAGGDEEIHVLGYGISPDAPELARLFQAMQEERLHRADAIMQKLSSISMPVDREQVFADAKGSVGRPHIARAMVQKGYVSTVQEAFEKYLGKGCSAFVSREKLSASYVISLIRSAGGVPVLAHPILLGWPSERLLPVLSQWKDAGLMGLEVYHPTQKADFSRWLRLARRYDLLVTGGSDFHAPNKPDGPLGGMADAWTTAREDVDRLLSHLSNQLI